MSDNTYEIVTHPGLAYSTKPNIRYPGSQTNATALAATAVTVFNDRLPSGVSITGLAITAAT